MGMRSYRNRWPCVVVVVVGNRQRPRVTRERETRWFGWFSVFGWRRAILLSLSAKQPVDQHRRFAHFPLASSAGRSVHTAGSLPPAASRHASHSHEEGLPTRIQSRCRPAAFLLYQFPPLLFALFGLFLNATSKRLRRGAPQTTAVQQFHHTTKRPETTAPLRCFAHTPGGGPVFLE